MCLGGGRRKIFLYYLCSVFPRSQDSWGVSRWIENFLLRNTFLIKWKCPEKVLMSWGGRWRLNRKITVILSQLLTARPWCAFRSLDERAAMEVKMILFLCAIDRLSYFHQVVPRALVASDQGFNRVFLEMVSFFSLWRNVSTKEGKCVFSWFSFCVSWCCIDVIISFSSNSL